MMDIHPERTPVLRHHPKLTVISLFVWLGIVAAVGMLVVGLSGCAGQNTFQGVCALKIMGQDEHGNVIARTYCEEKS